MCGKISRKARWHSNGTIKENGIRQEYVRLLLLVQVSDCKGQDIDHNDVEDRLNIFNLSFLDKN